jgi:hypothetical protein
MVGNISIVVFIAVFLHLLTLSAKSAFIERSLHCLYTFFGFSGTSGVRTINCFPSTCSSNNYHVNFSQRFGGKPVVMVSLAGVDVSNQSNLRFYVYATDITPSHFNIKYTTWGDTKIYHAKFSWIACA